MRRDIRVIVCVLMAMLSVGVVCDGQSQRRRGKGQKVGVVRVDRHPDMRVGGVVVDGETGEGLPFSNVYVRGTLVGTQTDMDGRYELVVPAAYDTLRFGAMGYDEQYRVVSEIRGRMDSVVVRLRPDNIAIEEIEVRPDDAPRRLLMAVIGNKGRNNPANHTRAEYEKYTRWEYSLANISDRTAERGLILKGAAGLMKVSAEDSMRYLPVYFSETLSENETQKDPSKSRTTVVADRTRGIDIFKQYEIGGFSNAMDNEVNFYDDVVKMLGVGFVSPIAGDCFHYYDYFIVDSVMTAVGVDSVKVYTVKYRPKNRGDKVFEGTMDVETKYYSPLRIRAVMPKGTNINFVKKLSINSSYQLVGDSVPFFGTNEMEVHIDYMPVNSDKKRLEILCKMYNSQSKVRLDELEPLELSKRALAIETIKTDGYKLHDDEYWAEHRHGAMSEEAQEASESIDSLNNVRSVKMFNYLAKAAMTGYVDVGNVEIGSIGEMFNTNKIEGLHLGAGLRTSKEISEQWVLSWIVGYGFKNSRPTYGAGVGYKFKSPMRRTLEVNYTDRLMKIGEDENILYLYENMLSTSETNIIAQLFKREEIDELYYNKKIQLRYNNEWFTGMQTTLQFTAQRQESPKYYPFTQGGESVDEVHLQELSLDFRLSWREKFIDDGLQRMYLTTYHPIVHFTVAGGATQVGDKRSMYARLHSTLKHRFYLGQTKLDVAVEDGIYFGKLPYSALNIARGNKTYGFYRYDFNLMNYLEFVCDKYVYVHADYQLDGLLFHKLPAVYKLGLREVVGAKMMYGGLGKRHEDMLDLPEGVGGPTKPYVEVNVGIDNILRFFRVDAVYRVVGDSRDGAPRWGVRVQFAVKL